VEDDLGVGKEPSFRTGSEEEQHQLKMQKVKFKIEGERPTGSFARLSRDAATGRGATQVVDISSETAKSCVVSSLISRRLRGNQGFFEGFLTLKWVDFSALRDIMPFFLSAMPCTRNVRDS
jgi:hypothetical protein